jgi:peroxiredoxin
LTIHRHSCLLLLLAFAQALAQQPQAGDGQSPFFSVPSAVSANSGALRFGAKLPEFEARDTSGRIWHLADLRGKFTLLYIWSTAEARMQDPFDRYPHVVEFLQLPELQRFYDEAKNSKNIQVLTFCRDYESGDAMRAQDYMKQKQYNFPVVTDYLSIGGLFTGNTPWVWKEQPSGSRYWIVNPEGQLAYPVRSWSFGHLLDEIERIAGLR